ncbi:MAG: hypothetical protein AAF747_01890 [Planctomycetota bacterium]
MNKLMFVCAGVAASSASATVLTFDPLPFNGAQLSQAYGDSVMSALQDGFSYGTDFGPTPNIVAAYGTGSTVNTAVLQWADQFGDLTNIAYGTENAQQLLVTLTADAGWLVDLRGFDIAGWPVVDYTINSVEVLANGSAVFSETNVLVRGATLDAEGRRHTSFDFAQGLQAREITIALDVSNITGTAQDNIGIDNVAFAQVVPAPGVAGSLLAAAAFGVRRRR